MILVARDLIFCEIRTLGTLSFIAPSSAFGSAYVFMN